MGLSARGGGGTYRSAARPRRIAGFAGRGSARVRPGPSASAICYESTADLAALAAAYGFGLARNHPFKDGNKRVAFVTMAVFLGLNGLDLAAAETDVVTTIVALASGELDEETLADWIRMRTERRPRTTG